MGLDKHFDSLTSDLMLFPACSFGDGRALGGLDSVDDMETNIKNITLINKNIPSKFL